MDAPAREKLRILILDDYAVVRQGVRRILGEKFDPLQFGEGKAGPEGLNLALGQPWDLVIIAIDLPDREGLEVLAELERMRPDQPMLVFIGRLKFRGATGAVTAGTEDDVDPANNPGERVSAVRGPAGETSGQSTLTMEAPSDLEPTHRRADLSNREREVLRLVGLGRTVKEISALLALSEKTISTYRSRILNKLRLKTTAELIRYAVVNHLAD